MNFISFPVNTTNIFPLANSHAGGQLLSEWNLRARESVDTDPDVEYVIGPSFTHSDKDFKISPHHDNLTNQTISSTIIEIAPGRALVNGHFIQSLTPILIDIAQANFALGQEGRQLLKGDLAIGLKMMYSTYQTLAGSALIENSDDYYEGVQVVIVENGKERLPKDETQVEAAVNMHLLLGTFSFKNGKVTNIKHNPEKSKSLDARRLSNMTNILSDIYVTKNGLNPNRIYTFAGKSPDGTNLTDKDTWMDSTDSLMIWDNNPQTTLIKPSPNARFEYNKQTGDVSLILPHKQVPGMKNTQGQDLYYQDKALKLPVADYESGLGGIVGKNYTNKIKEISNRVDRFYRLPNSRMRGYIPVLTDRSQLPVIPESTVANRTNIISDYFSDIHQIRASVSDVRKELKALSETILSTVDARVSNAASNYFTDQFNSHIESTNSAIKSIEGSIKELDRRIVQLEGANQGNQDAKIKELNNKIITLQGQIEELLKTVRDINTTTQTFIAKADKQINTAIQQHISSSTAKIDASLAKISATFSDLETKLVKRIDDSIRQLADKYNVTDDFNWRPGDYILVGEDQTIGGQNVGRGPSTIYMVGPSKILAIKYVDSIVSKLTSASTTNADTYKGAYDVMLRKTPSALAGGICIASANINSPAENSPTLWEVSNYRGTLGVDYFVARHKSVDETTGVETWTCYYYTPSLVENHLDYEDPIWITGQISLASETSIGGFLNVPSNAIGGGYVRVDDDGHLRLVDYELLLTGVLSYQLGNNYQEGSGLSIKELQKVLDENINDRVAFPNVEHSQQAIKAGEDPNVIHIYLKIEKDEGNLFIHDIGSRYGTSVHVHIGGTPSPNTTITFKNCDKLRIDSNISGTPNIILDNVNLYYDSNVLQQTHTINNLSLWYQRYQITDPDLVVDGMTVRLVDKTQSSESEDPWTTAYINDNHYAYSLKGLTFDKSGNIIGIIMLVGDSTTANIDEGLTVYSKQFILPQSIGLNYPANKVTRQLKVTGNFVSHYRGVGGYMMKNTSFTALTQKYDKVSQRNVVIGTISFYTDARWVNSIAGISSIDDIDGWRSGDYHMFIGGIAE